MGTEDYTKSSMGKSVNGELPVRGDSPLLEPLEPRLMMSGDPVLTAPQASNFSNFFNSADFTPIWDQSALDAEVSLLGITDGIDVTDVQAPSFDQLTTLLDGPDVLDANGDSDVVLSEVLLNGLKEVLGKEIAKAGTIDSLQTLLEGIDTAIIGTEADPADEDTLDDYVKYQIKNGTTTITESGLYGKELSFNFDTEFHKGLKIDLGEAGEKIGLSLGSITVDVVTTASLGCTIGLLDSGDVSTAYINFDGLNLTTDGRVASLTGEKLNLGFLGLEVQSGSSYVGSASIDTVLEFEDKTFPAQLGITEDDFSQSGNFIKMSGDLSAVTQTNEFTLKLNGNVTKNISVAAGSSVQSALNNASLGSVITAGTAGTNLTLSSLNGNFGALGLGQANDFTTGESLGSTTYTSVPGQAFSFTVFDNGAFRKVTIGQTSGLEEFKNSFNTALSGYGFTAAYHPAVSDGQGGTTPAKVTISGTALKNFSIIDNLTMQVGSILTASDMANTTVEATVDADSFTDTSSMDLKLKVQASTVDLGLPGNVMGVSWDGAEFQFSNFGALEQFKNITSDSFKNQLDGVAQWAEQELFELLNEQLDAEIVHGDFADVFDFKTLVKSQLVKPLVESDEPINLQMYAEALIDKGLNLVNYVPQTGETPGKIEFSFSPVNLELSKEISLKMSEVVKKKNPDDDQSVDLNTEIAGFTADPFAAISGALSGDISFSLNLSSITALTAEQIEGKTAEEIQQMLEIELGKKQLSEYAVESTPKSLQFLTSDGNVTVTGSSAQRSITLAENATFEVNGSAVTLNAGLYVGTTGMKDALKAALVTAFGVTEGEKYSIEYIVNSDSFMIKNNTLSSFKITASNDAAKKLFGETTITGSNSVTFRSQLSYLDVTTSADEDVDFTFTLTDGAEEYTVRVLKQKSAVTSLQALLEILKGSEAKSVSTTKSLEELVDVFTQSELVDGLTTQQILFRSKNATKNTPLKVSANSDRSDKLGLSDELIGHTNDVTVTIKERAKYSNDAFTFVGSQSLSFDSATTVGDVIALLESVAFVRPGQNNDVAIEVTYSNERGTFSVTVDGEDGNKEFSLTIAAVNGSLLGTLLGIVGSSDKGVLESERLAGATSDSLISLDDFGLNASYGISTSASKSLKSATVKNGDLTFEIGTLTYENLFNLKNESSTVKELVFTHSGIESHHVGSMITLKYSLNGQDATFTSEIVYVNGDKAAIAHDPAEWPEDTLGDIEVWAATVAGKVDTDVLYEKVRYQVIPGEDGDADTIEKSNISHSSLDHTTIGAIIKVTDTSDQVTWYTVTAFEDGFAILDKEFADVGALKAVEVSKGNFEIGVAEETAANVTGNAVFIETERVGTTTLSTNKLSEYHEGKWIVATQDDGTTTYHRIKDVRSGGEVLVTGEIVDGATITLAGVSVEAQIGSVSVSLLAVGGVSGNIGVSLKSNGFDKSLAGLIKNDALFEGENTLDESTITLALVADGLPFQIDPGEISLSFDLDDEQSLRCTVSEFVMPDVDSLKGFNIAELIDLIAQNITTILNSTIGDETIPIIDKKLNELVPVVQEFTDALNLYKESPTKTLQGLEEALEEAFGLSGYMRDRIGLDIGHIYNKDTNSWDKGLLLNFNNLGFVFNQSKSLSMDIGETFNLSGNVQADVFGYISANLGMGFTFSDGLKMHLNRDQTFVRSSIRVNADNISLGASVGPLGVYIKDYEGNDSNLGMSLSAGVEFDYDYFSESAWASIDEVFNGDLNFYAEGLQFYGDLHMYGPTDSIYLGSIKLGLGTGPGEVAYTQAEQKVYTEVTDLGIKLVRLTDGTSNIGNVVKGDLVVDITEFDPGGTIKNLLENLKDFDIFDGMYVGSEALDFLLGSLQERIDDKLSEVDLPIIGDSLSNGAGFVEEFREGFLQDFTDVAAAAAFTDVAGLDKQEALEKKANEFATQLALKIGDLLNDEGIDVEIDTRNGELYAEWDMCLTGAWEPTVGFDFDLGIPGFGMNGSAELVTSVEWRVYLGFGIDSKGFYVKLRDHETEDENGGGELELDISVALKESAPDKELFKGSLGFLELSAKQGEKDAARAAVGIAIDLDNYDATKPETDEIINFMDLASLDLTPRMKIGATADLALTLGIVSDAEGKFPNIDTTFSLAAGTAALLETDQYGNDTFGDASYVEFSTAIKSMKELTFGFNDITLDFGTFVDSVLGDTLRGIQKYTQPLQPMIDFLVSPFPVLGDLGINMTPLDLAKQFSKGKFNPDMIYAIADIISLVNSLPGEGASLGLPFGSVHWKMVNGKLEMDVEKSALLESAGELFANADRTRSSEGLGQFEEMAKDEAEESRWAFPIIQNPADNIVALLTGGNAVLVTYDMPELSFEFDWDKFIRIYGPLGINIGVNFGVEIDLAFGYDTMGIRNFIASDFKNPLLLTNGFYISDTVNPDGSGDEVSELVLYGALKAAVALNVGVAEVGVGGGVGIDIGFDLYDPDRDGRVRLYEMAETFLNEWHNGNKLKAPLSIFDIHGEIWAQLYAYVEFLWFRKEFEITPKIVLFQFDIKFERPQVLATVIDGRTDADPYSGNEFQINVGEFAGDRLNGNVEDGNENIEIFVDGDSFTASFNNKKSLRTYKALDNGEPKVIYFNGGNGNDTLTVTTVDGGDPGVFQFIATGGVGDDTIDLSAYKYAGDVANELTGNEGDDILKAAQGAGDVIIGGVGNDEVHGSTGDDIIFGDGGAYNTTTNKAAAFFKPDQDGVDEVYGGAGNDVIFGSGGSDKLHGGADSDIVIGDGGAVKIESTFTDSTVTNTQRDRLQPKGGADEILGGDGVDILYGGTGNDSIDGGAGNDFVYGQMGDDILYGGTGSDEVIGSVGNDVIFGERRTLTFNLADAFMGLPEELSDRELFKGDENDGGSTYHDSKLDGGDGADIIIGDFGYDSILGGTDIITAGTGADFIDGTAGDDNIKGGDDDDTIFGGTGSDTIDGEQGSDIIFGDRGHHDFTDATKSAAFESTREKEVFGFNDADKFGYRYSSDEDVRDGSEAATVSIESEIGLNNKDFITTGLGSDFVDSQTGADEVTMEVQTANRSSITNIADSGWVNFGENPEGYIDFDYSDRDKLFVVGTAESEKFLIRASLTGVGLVGVISNNDETLQRINVWGNNEESLTDEGLNLNDNDSYVGVDEVNVEAGAGDDKIALDGTVTQTNVFGGLRDKSTDNSGDKRSKDEDSGEDTFQIGQLYRSGRGEADKVYNKVLPDDYFNTTKVSLGYLSDGVNDVTNIYGGDGDDDFTVYRNTDQLNLYGESGDDNFLVKAFVEETVVEDEPDVPEFFKKYFGILQSFIERLTAANKTATGLKKFALDLKDVGKVYSEAKNQHAALENAVVNIDGGDGFDTVTIVGTELDDVFYVTEQGIFGAGVKVNYKGIERVVLDAAEGNDTVYVTGTSDEYITEIQGGKGSDAINIGDIDEEKTFKVPELDEHGNWRKEGNQVLMTDYTVSKDNVGRLDKFNGQLIVDGAGGNGAFVQSNPILLPHINVLGNVIEEKRIPDEQNERIEHGKLQDVTGRTVRVSKQNLIDALYSLWKETVTTEDELTAKLVNRTIAVTSGTSFLDEFRWIQEVEYDGNDAILTLNEAFTDATAEKTGFAIDDMSLNFFANEFEESDTISVNNTLADGTVPDSVDGESGPRTKNTEGALSDLSDEKFEFVNRKLGKVDLKHLSGFGMVGEHQKLITEKNKETGVKSEDIKNFPGGIVFGNMEVVEINLSETQENTLDITATTGRADGFQTWTVVNGGAGIDRVNVRDINADTLFTTEKIVELVNLNAVNGKVYNPINTAIATGLADLFEAPEKRIADLRDADISIDFGNGLMQKCKISSYEVVGSDIVLHFDRILKADIVAGSSASITRDLLASGTVDSYEVNAAEIGTASIVVDELTEVVDPVGAVIEILDENGIVLGVKEILKSETLAGAKQRLTLSTVLGLDSKLFDPEKIASYRILPRVNGPLVLQTGEGNDVIDIVNSNLDTVVVAGQGDDTITLGSGNNTVFGDDGVVTLSGKRALRTVPGTNPDPTATTTFGDGYTIDNDGVVRGIDEAKTIGTTGGKDIITIAGGSNIVFGGMGEDDITIQEGDGDDIAFGDNGKLVYENIEPVKVVGGDKEQSLLKSAESTDFALGASDMLITGNGSDIVIGGANDDFVNYHRDGETKVEGDNGNDVIVGDNGKVIFTTSADNNVVKSIESLGTVGGNDTIYFGNGDQDIVIGGVGSDVIEGGDDALAQEIPFNEKVDVILGDNGSATWNNDGKHIIEKVVSSDLTSGATDYITAGNGNDVIIGGQGGDVITGGTDVGKDIVLGDNGEIEWDTSSDKSLLKKVSSTDTTAGFTDWIKTGDGDDVIIGGMGADYINLDPHPMDDYTIPSDEPDNGDDVIVGDNGVIEYDVFTNHSTIKKVESVGIDGGADRIYMGNGDQDIVIGGVGGDVIIGGDAALEEQTPMDDKVDVIIGDNGSALWINTEDKHLIKVVRSDDSETAGLGYIGYNDRIIAANGNDIVIGGEGSDYIHAGEDAGKDVVLGDSGDIHFNTEGSESLVERIESRPVARRGEGVFVGGDDTIITGDGDDIVLAGNGDDLVNAEKISDWEIKPLEDDNGDDVILGDNGYVQFDIIANLSMVRTVETIDYLDEWGYRSERSGDDIIYFGNGDRDIVFGGLGKDWIIGGDDSVAAGSDLSQTQDVIFGDNGIAQWVNTEEKHLIQMVASKVYIRPDGTSPEDVEENSDIIRAENGNDIVIGGMGGDSIAAGTDEGSDVILGDNGEAYWDTTLAFSRIKEIRTTETNMGGTDYIWSGDGDDIVLGGAKGDFINAQMEGEASYRAGSGDYELDRGDDVMLGDNGEVLFDLFSGGSKVFQISSNHNLDGGDDRIVTGNGADIVIAGVGNDLVDARGYYWYMNSQDEEGDTVIGDNGVATWTNDESKHIIKSIASTEEEHGGQDVIGTGIGHDLIIGGYESDEIYTGELDGNDIVIGDNGRADWNTDLSFSRLDIIKTTARDIGGDDYIETGDGDDVVLAGMGNDSVNMKDRKIIDNDNGSDVIVGDNGTADYDLTDTGSVLKTISTDHDLNGGDDEIFAGNGDDFVIGGVGNDYLHAGNDEGDDIVIGDNGIMEWDNDTVAGAHLISRVESQDRTVGGDDEIVTGSGDDITIAGAGSDKVNVTGTDITESLADDGNDMVLGDNGSVLYEIINNQSMIKKFTSDDDLTGSTDYISTGNGDDIVIAGMGDDEVDLGITDAGNDKAIGDNGSVIWDNISRMASNIYEIASENLKYGGSDHILSGDGDDVVIGGIGSDYINADRGHNSLAPVGTTHEDTGVDVIVGDNGLIDYEISYEGDNYIRTIQTSEYDRELELDSNYSTDGDSDVIYSGNGNDVVIAGVGSDWVDTGSDGAQDFVMGDNGVVHMELVNVPVEPAVVSVEWLLQEMNVVSRSTGGDDNIFTGDGGDKIIAGLGKDAINYNRFTDQAVGQHDTGNDTVIGDNGYIRPELHDSQNPMHEAVTDNMFNGDVDIIHTFGGNDTVLGGEGGDEIHSGAGDDVIIGDSGVVRFTNVITGYGTYENEIHEAVSEVDLNPSEADDTIFTGSGNDVAIAGRGSDTITSESRAEDTIGTFIAGDGGRVQFTPGLSPTKFESRDEFPDKDGVDTIIGGDGNTYVIGGGNDDTVTTGAGDDVLIGDKGQITFNASGNGNLKQINNYNSIVGGDDTLSSGTGSDWVIGGVGSDTIHTGNDNDFDHAFGGNILVSFDEDGFIHGGVQEEPLVSGTDTIVNPKVDIMLYPAFDASIASTYAENTIVRENGALWRLHTSGHWATLSPSSASGYVAWELVQEA